MSAGERWRCFVAVAVGDDVRARLADAIAAWREDPRTDGLRWVDADALHLTLAFLGSVQPPALSGIQREIELVAGRHAPMTVATRRLGAFDRSGSARVLWYGVEDGERSLAAIAADLAAGLRLDSNEPFRAHVTLARARRRSVDLRGWIEPASEAAPQGTIVVRALELKRSHLGSGPARYETLKAFPLMGSPE